MLADLLTTRGPTTAVFKFQTMVKQEHKYVYQEPKQDRKFKLPPVDQSRVLEAVEERLGPLKPPHNDYRSVEEVGVIPGMMDASAAQHTNRILLKLTNGLQPVNGFLTEWGLTDVSAAATFGVYDQKVDTPPVEEHQYRDLEDEVWEVMRQKMSPKLRETRMLTYQEAVDRLRNDAAVGMGAGLDWKVDPEVEKLVREELDNILLGKPRMAWVNTMGKREKKKRKLGKNKGSRLISYYPIVFRICEQMIMGDLLDQLSVREVNPMAVGHMNPTDYFQQMAEDEANVERDVSQRVHAIADDTAGWDTRVSRMDLEREAHFFSLLVDDVHGGPRESFVCLLC